MVQMQETTLKHVLRLSQKRKKITMIQRRQLIVRSEF